MNLSDQWVAEGCRLDSLLLAQEHAALVRAYAALLTAKLPQRDAMPPSGTGSRSRSAAAVLTLRGLALASGIPLGEAVAAAAMSSDVLIRLRLVPGGCPGSRERAQAARGGTQR